MKAYITGNTYEHRDELRRSGAIWNKDAKRWEIEIREHGMKRNDGELYRLRKLGGLRIDREVR
jgi:hypothetical protein